MNYEAERLILIGMLELICEQQLVSGVRPTFSAAIKCLNRFPLSTDHASIPLCLATLSACLPEEAFERTHAGSSRAVRLQHERLISAVLR